MFVTLQWVEVNRFPRVKKWPRRAYPAIAVLRPELIWRGKPASTGEVHEHTVVLCLSGGHNTLAAHERTPRSASLRIWRFGQRFRASRAASIIRHHPQRKRQRLPRERGNRPRRGEDLRAPLRMGRETISRTGRSDVEETRRGIGSEAGLLRRSKPRSPKAIVRFFADRAGHEKAAVA